MIVLIFVLQMAGKRQCSGSNAALMLALGLPGSVSIYYDYEMGLQMPHNSK